MKKVFLLAALLVASMSMMAEEPQSAMNQVVWHNGKVMYGSPIPTVDSITFAAEIEFSDTLHLILPRTIVRVDTVIKEVIVEVHDTIIQNVYQCPEKPLAGVFSVSDSKQVRFSKGNLQYTQSTDTWAFAENQYDMIGEANIENDALADKIDLFGWSGSTSATKWGISASTDNNDYSGDFIDWGKNIDCGSTWRLLTYEDYRYIMFDRTDADRKKGVARIQIDEEKYSNGLILLPDNWTCPNGISFKSGLSSESTEEAYGAYQTFSLAQWEKLEAAGAVFLPAAGIRMGTKKDWLNAQISGFYWTSTPMPGQGGWDWGFGANCVVWHGLNRYYGASVRLVQDL